MSVLPFFNHPVVATVILALAFLGLLVEVRSRGFRRAGWAGLLALGLFAASHVAAGTPLWTALPVAAGVVALWPALGDPGRRVAAVAGLLLVAGGAYAVMVGPGPARLDHARAAAVLLGATLLVVLAATVLWWRLPASERPPRRTGVFFGLPPAPPEGPGPRDAIVGERGRAVSELRPGGWAVVRGERLPVVAEGEWLQEGDEVEVVDQTRVHVRVRRADPPPREGGVDAAPRPG